MPPTKRNRRSKTKPSREKSVSNKQTTSPLARSNENLSWYTFGLTKEPKEFERLQGWAVLTKALTEPVANEAVTDYTSNGKLILEQTPRLRTIKSQRNGDNALIKWRENFMDKDEHFVEFIKVASKLCSFTVPTSSAIRQLLRVIDSMNTWANNLCKKQGNKKTKAISPIVPQFRIVIAQLEAEEGCNAEEENALERDLAQWESVFKNNDRLFSLNIVFEGENPNISRAHRLVAAAKHFCAAPVSYQFDEEALSRRFATAQGDEVTIAQAKDYFEALMVSHLLHPRVQYEMEDKKQNLLVHLLSVQEGKRMLKMCDDHEVFHQEYFELHTASPVATVLNATESCSSFEEDDEDSADDED